MTRLLAAVGYAFLLAPLLLVAVMSVSDDPFLTFPPHGWSLRWYGALFHNGAMLAAARNSAIPAMKRSAVLVNVARGGVVVEADLIWALQNEVIHAAAMDVFETEPLPPDSPLYGVAGLTITPHIAAGSVDVFDKTVAQMFRNIGHVSRGEPVPERDSVVG